MAYLRLKVVVTKFDSKLIPNFWRQYPPPSRYSQWLVLLDFPGQTKEWIEGCPPTPSTPVSLKGRP